MTRHWIEVFFGQAGRQAFPSVFLCYNIFMMNAQIFPETVAGGSQKPLFYCGFARSIPSPFVRRHPHSAFVRHKTETGLRIALHTPIGKLTALTDEAGVFQSPFVRHPRDIDRLCSYLRDVEYLPEDPCGCDILYAGWLAEAEFDAYWAFGSAESLRCAAPEETESCDKLLKKLQTQRVELCLQYRPAYLVLQAGGDIPASAEKLYAKYKVPLLIESMPGAAALGQHIFPLLRWEDIRRHQAADYADGWMALLDAKCLTDLRQAMQWLAQQPGCRGILVENDPANRQ